jgi:hypothetical protein
VQDPICLLWKRVGSIQTAPVGCLTVPNLIISQRGRFRCSKYLIPSVLSESLEILVKNISGNDAINTELTEPIKFFLGIVQSCSKLFLAVICHP